MLASSDDLWVGYRFYSEGAHDWARRSACRASRVVALYFADTKYQFRTDLPSTAEVVSVAELDSQRLNGMYEDLIRVLLRGLELPSKVHGFAQLDSVVRGRTPASMATVVDADVHEALAALKCPCASKAELRYQLAAGVVLNRWIEDECRQGRMKRRKFYAFKQRISELAEWAFESGPEGVSVWAERTDQSSSPLLYVRVDGVDFSFHAIPCACRLLTPLSQAPQWSGVRLKPIAPLVLEWARLQLERAGGLDLVDRSPTIYTAKPE